MTRSYDFKRSGGQDSSGEETDGMECLMFAVNKLNEPCMTKAKVQNCLLKMEIDSGSAVSVISEADCKKFFNGIPMRSSSRQLIVVDCSIEKSRGSFSAC